MPSNQQNGSMQKQLQNLQSVASQYEQLSKQVYDEYSQQLNKNQQTKKRNQQLSQKKDHLSNQIVETLQLINKQIVDNVKKKKSQLSTVNNKLACKNNNALIISQNQYFYKTPQLHFNLKNIQVPEGINSIIKQFTTVFQNDKNTLENQITKLKILIKLSQMNKQDTIAKPSKSHKNQ